MVQIISTGPFPLSDLIAHSEYYMCIYKIMLQGLINLQCNVITIHYLCNMDIPESCVGQVFLEVLLQEESPNGI